MGGGLKGVLPHHAFYGFIGLAIVLGILLLVVFDHDLSIYGKIDELTDGHAFVDLYRLFDGDLEGPVAAKADIAFPCRGVNVDAQPACRRLALQEGYMGVGFGIFVGYPQVKDVWIQHETLLGDLEVFDLVVFFCVQDVFPVGSQPFAEVDVVGIASQASPVVRHNFYCSLFYFFKDTRIG